MSLKDGSAVSKAGGTELAVLVSELESARQERDMLREQLQNTQLSLESVRVEMTVSDGPRWNCSRYVLLVWLGFPRLLESSGFFLENFQALESPGKWIWSWKVLEIFVEGPAKSWNFLLGYDVGGRHDGVGAAVYNANSCDKFSDNLFAISQ